MEVRSSSLTLHQGDQHLSVQLSFIHWCMMPLVKDDDNLATALSAHDIYKLDGYVPLTEKSGETSDINQFS